MSQWTHINAVIRFDSVAALGMNLPDMSNVPSGSEGPMQLVIVKNPHDSSMASHTAMFWGDLRDYDNRDEIADYFNSITENQMIRSGLLEIEVEGRPIETFRFNNDHGVNKWEAVSPKK